MTAVPGFMKGAYRSAMRAALAEIHERRSHHPILPASRGWKLFLVLPRLLLHRSPRRRFRKCSCSAEWKRSREENGASLLASEPERFARVVLRVAAIVQPKMISTGGCSGRGVGAHGSIVGSPPGNRRHRFYISPYSAIRSHKTFCKWSPANPFVIDPELSARNVRSARRGRPVRHDRTWSRSQTHGLSVTHCTISYLTLFREGRLTALEKSGGGVRGIVCGDIVH